MTIRHAAPAAVLGLLTILPAAAHAGDASRTIGIYATVPTACRVDRSPSTDGRSFDATVLCDAPAGWRMLAIPVVPVEDAEATVDGVRTALDRAGGTVVASGDGPVHRTMRVDLSLPDASSPSAVILVMVPRT